MNSSADLLKSLKIDRSAPPPPTSRKGLWIGVGVAAAVVLGAGGAWFALGRNQGVEVQVADVVAIGNGGATSASVLDATGYVVARRMATVSAKVTGKVREVLIEEGMRVDDGQVLATLDSTQADAQLAMSQAQLDSARSQLLEIEANLRQAQADLKRQQEIFDRKLGTAAQLDAARAAAESLSARLASQRRQIRVAQESLAMSQVSVDDTVIRAPFAGVIIAKAAQPGEMISPISAGGGFTRTGIGTIVDMDSLEVEVDVGESFIGRVQPKMPIEATLNAYPDWKIPGEVIAIIPTADRGKATVKVRVALNQRDARIVPDMGVRVSFMEAAKPAAATMAKPGVLAPGAAIVSRDDAEVAFVVLGDTARQRTLKLGRTLGDDREVLEGLNGGDTVVLDPPDTLVDGAKIRVAPADSADAEEE